MNEYYSSNSGYERGGNNFARTNFILKEDAAKVWPTYSVSGVTEFKPYPVFDQNGVPCPPRMVSRFEADGNIPAAESLTPEEIREYELEVIPAAFTRVPTVSWVGRERVQFIDFCQDIMNFQNEQERENNVPPPTPYTTMVRVLNRLIPTDKYAGDGKPCPKTLQRSRGWGDKVIGLRMSAPTFLVRGALLKHKGQQMSTKSSVNGVLYRTCLMIPQKSARLALRNRFSEKINLAAPISAENFPFANMFNPSGTTLVFSKVDPTNSQSDTKVDNGYDQVFNQALMEYFGVTDAAGYFAKVWDVLGAFPTMESMLNIMTVQQQLDLIIKQFPAAWVWYGLRDSRYEKMIPESIQREALRDPEWAERFGIAQAVTLPQLPHQQDQVPMNFPVNLPKVSTENTGVPAYPVPTPQAVGTPVQVPPGVQQTIDAAAVSYQPKSQSQSDPTNPDATYLRLMKQYGGQ